MHPFNSHLRRKVLRRSMSRRSLPWILMVLIPFFFFLFFFSQAIKICPELSFGCTSGSFTFGLFHFFQVVILFFTIVIDVAFVFDREQTDLVFLFYFLGDDLKIIFEKIDFFVPCLLYTSPSPRDLSTSRMPSSA